MTKENSKCKSMNDLIEELVIEDADFVKIQDALSVYCPFEAVGMVNAEIRHSAFLAHSMDPYRPHGFGAEFLRITLDTIIKSLEAAPISRLELHLADFDDVEVRREWRHIDVLVTLPTPRLIIAFELKIGANEGHDQLGRYSRALEDAWPSAGEHPWRHLKLFLTRTGEQPSDPSWYAVDYSLIIAAIDKFKTASAAGTLLARETLVAYANMLRRRHMGNVELEKIAETLWKKHAEALTYLMENRPDADGGLAQLLIEKSPDLAAAATIATAGRLTLAPDESNKRWIRFRVAEWASIPGLTSSSWTASGHIILIQIEVDPTFVKLFVTLGPGPEAVRNELFAALEDLMRRKSSRSVSGWKTISSKFVLTRDSMLRADGPETLLDDIKKALEVWMQNEVSAVDMRLQQLVAQPRP